VQPDGKIKVPFFLNLNDQDVFANRHTLGRMQSRSQPLYQVLYAHNLAREQAGGGDPQHETPILTILPREDREAWLTGSADEAWATLKRYYHDHTVSWPVSNRVNSPNCDNAQLIYPLPMWHTG
jgi:putative SOS response-associated peptidase YedK